MSVQKLLNLKEDSMSDSELLEKINEAVKSNKSSITITDKDGKLIEITIKKSESFECGIMD